ncbi:MAG: hypothetical protein PHW22_02360 [Bacilli bacterium]|nr:hypothetical protein [Bacilli bacterium]
METKGYTKRLFITYIVLGIVAIAISTIGLIWSNWEIIACVSIGILIGIINYYFLIFFSNKVSGNDKGSLTSFMSGYGLRFLLQVIGLGLSVLLIYLTRGNSVNTFRYFNILGTGVGYVLPAIVSSIVKQEKIEKKEESK